MKNRWSLAFFVFVALIAMAAVVPVEMLKVYNAANHTKVTTITQSGTGLAVDTGIAATGPISGTTGTFTGAMTVDTTTLVVDATNNRVGIGTETPQTLAHVLGSVPILRVEDTAAGIAAITRLMHGIELIAGGMNGSTASCGTAIKFMSTDPQFTTENPKLLAGIFPRGTETYSADTSGGMAIDFATCPNSVGTTAVPSVRMTVDQNGYVGIGTMTPASKLEINGNVSLSNGTYIVLPGGCRDWGMRSAAPTSPTPAEGDRYYNTASDALFLHNGSAWERVTRGASYAQTGVAATSEIYIGAMNVNLTAYSAVTLDQDATHEVIDTSTAIDGQVLTLVNIGSYAITLPCYAAGTTYSKVVAQGGGASIVLAGSAYAHDGATFRYVASLGRWVQIG